MNPIRHSRTPKHWHICMGFTRLKLGVLWLVQNWVPRKAAGSKRVESCSGASCKPSHQVFSPQPGPCCRESALPSLPCPEQWGRVWVPGQAAPTSQLQPSRIHISLLHHCCCRVPMDASKKGGESFCENAPQNPTGGSFPSWPHCFPAPYEDWRTCARCLFPCGTLHQKGPNGPNRKQAGIIHASAQEFVAKTLFWSPRTK